jgi:tetratricopeptide (TPR) repeat protein
MDRPPLPDLTHAITYDERLRQAPLDQEVVEEAAAEAVARLLEAEAEGDRADLLRLHGYLGDVCRVLGRLEESLRHLEIALKLARALGDQRAEVANLIRLGETHRYREDYPAAEALLRDALDRSRADPALADYQGFALQHLGKCLLEQGDVAGAIDCLERALALREDRGNPELVESTRQALDLAVRLCDERAGRSG